MADANVQAGITLGIALLGAALGVINTCWAIWRDRARLKVVPVWTRIVADVGNGQHCRVSSEYQGGLAAHPDGQFAVKVINYGFFDVTVESVGLTQSGLLRRCLQKSRLRRRAIMGDLHDQVRLPKRLAPRESITIVGTGVGTELDAALRGSRRVYVTTSCGLDFYGTSGLFRRLTREARTTR